MQRSFSFILSLAVIPVLFFLPGCARRPAPVPLPPLTVTAAKPIERQATDYADFTGRTDAIFSTDIRPRVTGYLVGMPFKEGGRVTKDQVLFEIDDRPYKAALELAKASEDVAKAALVKAQGEYDVGLLVQKQSKDAISVQELTRRLGARDEAKANVERAKAEVVNAQLNYDWCKVRSPIDGEADRYLLTLGNLVNADVTQLTTVVSENPMYVYFDVDENTMLDVMRTVVLPSNVDLLAKKGGVPVLMRLADEGGRFPHKGYVDFGSNTVNASTGTILIRGVFANPATRAGKRLLRPGMFVRVRLPLSKPHPSLLVSETALQSDQGQKFLLLVNDQGVVEYRRVKTGPLQEDDLRVISEGLKPGERVITSRLQMVRPGMTVKVEETSMPTSPADEPLSDRKNPGGKKN
ncbi:MAG: efflux RND transporter periplasmic adaptor subunit [Thermoguttaceae bacterium]